MCAGLDLLLAAQKVGPTGRVIGVDMTDEMLEKARANIARSGHQNIEVRKGTIEALPIEDGTIDWVISNCVINLSSEKELVFSEIARVLKPDGKMLVSDIVAENLPFWLRASKILQVACVGGAISEAKYLSSLTEAGLQQSAIIDRMYYDAGQMADVVAELVPEFVTKISCCGRSLVKSVVTKAAAPITTKLWSARIYAVKPS